MNFALTELWSHPEQFMMSLDKSVVVSAALHQIGGQADPPNVSQRYISANWMHAHNVAAAICQDRWIRLYAESKSNFDRRIGR